MSKEGSKEIYSSPDDDDATLGDANGNQKELEELLRKIDPKELKAAGVDTGSSEGEPQAAAVLRELSEENRLRLEAAGIFLDESGRVRLRPPGDSSVAGRYMKTDENLRVLGLIDRVTRGTNEDVVSAARQEVVGDILGAESDESPSEESSATSEEKPDGRKPILFDDKDRPILFDKEGKNQEAEASKEQPEAEAKIKELNGLLDAIDKAHSQDRPQKLEALKRATELLGDERFAGATVHRKEKRGGADKDEYTVPRAMKDAYELARRRLSEMETEIREGKKRKEDREVLTVSRELLDYLNKARQNSEEAAAVYRYVMDNKGVDPNRAFPEFLKKRPDLLERFNDGMGQPYSSDREAAHDLIEFLAQEAEDRIKEIERGKDAEKDKFPYHLDSHHPVKEGEQLVRKEGEQLVRTVKKGEQGPDTVPPIPENIRSEGLDEARSLYLKALRLRGNVFRGAIGRLFGRTLKFKGKKLDFGGPQDLELVRKNYEDELFEARKEHVERRAQELEQEGVPVEEREAKMQEYIVGLMAAEQGQIDQEATEGIEKNAFSKLKEWWKRQALGRVIAGGALAGVAALTGGTAVAAGAVGTRAVMGGVGTYVGVEAGIERYSKRLGHKGLIDQIQKEVGADNPNPDALREHISGLDFGDVQREIARLRMLKVEKGTSLDYAGRMGEKTALIAELLIERERTQIAQELASEKGRGEEEQLADFISNRLKVEEEMRNATWEDETDREHVKKLGRKVTAVVAGGTVGWLIGGKLFLGDGSGAETIRVEATERFSPDGSIGPDVPPEPDGAGTPEAPAPEGGTETPEEPRTTPEEPTPEGGAETSEPEAGADTETPAEPGATPEAAPGEYVVEVGDGNHLWGLIENKMDSDGLLGGLDVEQRTYVIDKMKDIFATIQEQGGSQNVGIGSGDIDLIQVGEQVDLSPALGDSNFVTQALEEARNLSAEALQSIKENNQLISDWARAHPGEFLSSEKVAEILAGTA